MLERYYNRPILYDYVFSLLVLVLVFYLIKIEYLNIPNPEQSLQFASEVGIIGLTVSGFILTLLTILMTLKSGQILNEEKITNKSSTFKVFLASDLYLRSVTILRNGVLSLITICFFIFFMKLLFQKEIENCMFYLNITGLLIIATTFLRCFYVLNLIIKMHKKSANQSG